MKINKTEPIKTVLTISLGFLIIYLIFKWNWAIWVSLIIGVLGLFSPYLSKLIDYLWMKLALVLGFIIPNILLSAIFFLFLFPISLIAKLFGKKDPLKLKNTFSSVYENSTAGFDKKNLEHPW
jgi:hypothetical protein